MRSLVVVLLACLASPVTGHAIMINPTPRTGTDGGGQGNKLQPFGDARNSNCGGANNGDPPPFNAALRQPTEAFTPGSSINVQWELTIPHDADNLDIGVRVAVHYSCDDSFNDNILVGCLDGDPGCDDQTNAGVYLNRKAAAADGSPAGTIGGVIVDLPPGKTSNYAVIQWVWQARSDGGYYVQCADIAIVAPPGAPRAACAHLHSATKPRI